MQEQYAELLDTAGIDSVPEHAQPDPKNLPPKIATTNEKKNLVRKLPTRKQVADWIAQAKKLPRVITY